LPVKKVDHSYRVAVVDLSILLNLIIGNHMIGFFPSFLDQAVSEFYWIATFTSFLPMDVKGFPLLEIVFKKRKSNPLIYSPTLSKKTLEKSEFVLILKKNKINVLRKSCASAKIGLKFLELDWLLHKYLRLETL
jgi:hypothetical protein